MQNTSDFIRKVLSESFSDETPCAVCTDKSENNNNIVSTHGYYNNNEEVKSQTKSSTVSTNSLAVPKRPLSSAKDSHLTQRVKATVPALSQAMSKGACGRIGIIGGCTTHTGAAYFAAISALKSGADIVHIFCDAEAGPVLRMYCAELIIHPTLDQEYGLVELDAWLPNLDCVVLGHGLGKSQQLMGRISIILDKIKRLKLPIVIDGDGLRHVMVSPGVLRGYKRAVITVNTEELSQLVEALLQKEVPLAVCTGGDIVEELSRALGHVTIIHKGEQDIISDGYCTEDCHAGGSPRRCGGQGNILTGMVATFLHWSYSSESCPEPSITAGWGACRLVRACAEQGYNMEGRSLTAAGIVNQIHSEFARLFESETFF